MITMQAHCGELLDELVRANLDVETAFSVCACVTRSDRLSAMLLVRARLCGEAARTLSAILGAREDRGSGDVAARTRDTPDWVRLQEAMLAHDDTTVRDECVRTEEETLMRFRDILEYDLPWDLHRVVQKYFAALLEHYGGLRALALQGPADEPRPAPLRLVRPATITGYA